MGTVIAALLFLKLFVLPFKGVDHSPFILGIGFSMIILSAVFCGLKLFVGAVNTRIVITEKEMIITIGKNAQNFNIADFVDFLPVNEHEYLDSYKFLVFKHGADNNACRLSLPGMTDENYSYVLLSGVSNRQYKKMMIWLPSVLKDMTLEKDKDSMPECPPLSYEKLVEEYSGREKQQR